METAERDVHAKWVSQEEQVEDRVIFAEVNEGPAEHAAAHGQEAETGRDQDYVAEQ